MNKFAEWLDKYWQPHNDLFAKRLSANDTQASGGHQAGPYIPKNFLFAVFPELANENERNPRITCDLIIHTRSQDFCRTVTVIWYNNKCFGGTRNETRITGLGGSRSPLLDPEATGFLVLFSFIKNERHCCRVWLCNQEEEDYFTGLVGSVEPGHPLVITKDSQTSLNLEETALGSDLTNKIYEGVIDLQNGFPSPREIVNLVVQLSCQKRMNPDDRLIYRRNLEYELFQLLEQKAELPIIKQGFSNMTAFIIKAQSILQRRKSRAGISLELHIKSIFEEENLKEDVQFSFQPVSEDGKKPDFLFPCKAAYTDENYPDGNLRMLAVKTTCRDRWRQILNEADRVKNKHLLTLQEGMSENQFAEMSNSNVQLVVPRKAITAYPKPIRDKLMSFNDFIKEVSELHYP